MRYLIFVLFSLLTFKAIGQNPVMKVVSDTSCMAYIETPILVSDFDSVAAISMKIVFDTTRLTYLGYRNAHPAVAQNGNFIASTYQDRFIIGWFSLNPITISSDTLLVIRWQGTPGAPVRLWFDTTRGMCELVDFYGVRFNTQFIDGAVAPEIRIAPNLLSPPDTSGFLSTDVLFVYAESPCRSGPSIIQVSKDSSFPEDPLVSLNLSSPTFYRWFNIPYCGTPFAGPSFPDNGPCWSPSTGDSLIYWRVGAVYDSDTLWSNFRRIKLGLSANSSFIPSRAEAKLFPNPVENQFCVQVYSAVNIDWESAVLYSFSGISFGNIALRPSSEEEIFNEYYERCFVLDESLDPGLYVILLPDQLGRIHVCRLLKS